MLEQGRRDAAVPKRFNVQLLDTTGIVRCPALPRFSTLHDAEEEESASDSDGESESTQKSRSSSSKQKPSGQILSSQSCVWGAARKGA